VGTPLAFAFSNLWSYIPGYGKCINGFVQTCKLYKPIALFVSERLENEKSFLQKEWVKKDKKEVLDALKNIRTLYWALAKDPQRTFNAPRRDNVNQSRPEPSSSNEALLSISNNKKEAKLIPGTSKFFCKFYFFKNLCMLLISLAIFILTSVHAMKIENLPEEINCEVTNFSQKFACLLLSRDVHRVVYICFFISSFAIFLESFALSWYYCLSKNLFDIDLFLSFAELSSEMESLNEIPRFVDEVNSQGFKVFLQKCAIEAFNARDLQFFVFCVQTFGMSPDECLEHVTFVQKKIPPTEEEQESIKFRTEIKNLEQQP